MTYFDDMIVQKDEFAITAAYLFLGTHEDWWNLTLGKYIFSVSHLFIIRSDIVVLITTALLFLKITFTHTWGNLI